MNAGSGQRTSIAVEVHHQDVSSFEINLSLQIEVQMAGHNGSGNAARPSVIEELRREAL